MMKITPVMLRRVHLLRDLSDDELTTLSKVARVRTFAKGDFVLHKGDNRSDLLFLITGRLQVIDYTGQGREVVLHIVHSGDYFGELSVIDGKERSASVTASKESIVVFLTQEHALSLFYSKPSVAKRLLERFAYNIRQASVRQMLLNTASAHSRVYLMLLELLDRQEIEKKAQHQNGENQQNALQTINNLPTQQELANMVNTSRETVSRSLKVLLQKGIIGKDKRRIIIINRKALESLIVESSAIKGKA